MEPRCGSLGQSEEHDVGAGWEEPGRRVWQKATSRPVCAIGAGLRPAPWWHVTVAPLAP